MEKTKTVKEEFEGRINGLKKDNEVLEEEISRNNFKMQVYANVIKRLSPPKKRTIKKVVKPVIDIKIKDVQVPAND